MTLPFGWPAVIFSAKSFAAAMLALYIAFSIGLPNPYWAVITAYVVSQPRAGAVLSKSVYRVLGTVAGAAISIWLVPPLVHAPELLSPTIALWLGLCVFASILERGARSYLFALAGYTSCIIVFPSVMQPGVIFDTAALRVQEITLGILCSTLIHSLILPGSMRETLLARLDIMLTDGARWTADILSRSGHSERDTDRRRLALDINDMHDLLIHSSYERDDKPFRVDAVRALLVRSERLLPLMSAIDDRLIELDRWHGPAKEVTILLADVRTWLLKQGDDPALRDQGKALRERCRVLEPRPGEMRPWRDWLTLSLLARLSDLIEVRQDCIRLRAAVAGLPTWLPERRLVRKLIETSRRGVHRDVAGAIGAGCATAVTLFLANLLWIASGWEGGSSGVMLAGVYFAIYAGNANPTLLLRNKFTGVVLRLVLGAFYVLVVMPAIDGFPMLALSLAPALLLCGALMTTPRYSPLAFNLIIGVLGPGIIAERFQPDFVEYLNNGLATLSGIYFALIMMHVSRFLWVDGAADRLMKASWRDIGNRRFGSAEGGALWRSQMMHRLALLSANGTNGKPRQGATDMLRDMMTGLSLARLGDAERQLPTDMTTELRAVLDEASIYYRMPGHPGQPPCTILAHIDRGLRNLEAPSNPIGRAAGLALVSVRRNLFPEASAPA